MGRWIELEGHVGDGSFLAKNPQPLMEHHNADCDAYEARIAELEGEAEEATDMAIHYRDSAMAGDVVIGKLLAMLKKCAGVDISHLNAPVSKDFLDIVRGIYARACEITGRTE